jgi:drug/metabolite transporter (DMT)-like permease
MSTFLTTLAVAILWGVADVLRKYSSRETSSHLLTFAFNLGATTSPLALLCWSISKGQSVRSNTFHVILSWAGGLLVGLGGLAG